jgi:hypothetical protein
VADYAFDVGIAVIHLTRVNDAVAGTQFAKQRGMDGGGDDDTGVGALLIQGSGATTLTRGKEKQHRKIQYNTIILFHS